MRSAAKQDYYLLRSKEIAAMTEEELKQALIDGVSTSIHALPGDNCLCSQCDLARIKHQLRFIENCKELSKATKY